MINFPVHIVTAAGLVKNEEGKVLLVKSERRGWEFPGGQVEVGESIIEALIREVKEESGTNINVLKPVGISQNLAERTVKVGEEYVKVQTIVNHDFICEYVSGDLKTSDETSEVGFYTIAEALNMITTPKIKLRFENMIREAGKMYYISFKDEPFEVIKIQRL